MTNQQTRTTTKQTDQATRQPKPRPTAATPAVESGELQRALDDPSSASPQAVLAVQKSTGNRATSHLIQTKLTVGAAGDQYEQEADQVAEQVMTMPAPASHQPTVQRHVEEEEEVQRAPEDEDELQMKPLAASITPLVQRHAEEEEAVQRAPEEEVQRCAACDELQTKRSGAEASFQVGDDLEQRIASSRGNGSPLSPKTRAFMEPRFGSDFSGVRVHTDGESAQMNRDLSAQAFTLGQDIYMGAGKYAPSSSDGQQLLAHELTHVVQQTGPQLKEEEDEVQRLPLAPEHIQRHGSAEHMLLGEVDPRELSNSAKASVSTENRLHSLHQELKRARTWHQKGPLAVTEGDGVQYQVRMVNIGREKRLWLTYGEMNAMPDYVSSPDAIENGETEMLGKLIQHIRYESVRWIREQVERIVGEERKTIKPIRYDTVGDPPVSIPVYSDEDQKRLNELSELERQEPGLTMKETGAWDLATDIVRPISGQSVPLAGAIETKGLDSATAGLGKDKYSNLLGRNACHFAPYSWDRWYQFHVEARATALKAFNEKNEATKKQLFNSALIQNGYADHFLQDSFASGHLINKTLVMQWYVEWMKTKYAEIARSQLEQTATSLSQSAESTSQWGQTTQQNWNKSAEGWSEWGQKQQQSSSGFFGTIGGWAARAAGGTMWALGKGVGGLSRAAGGVGWGAQKGAQGVVSGAGMIAGIPMPSDWDQIKDMTQAQQPGLAGMQLYQGPLRQRKPGESTDPQTADEQITAQERMTKSGVKGGWKEYQNYLTFLKKGPIQLVTGRLHDHFCKKGLVVKNGAGEDFKVYGDYNLLTTGEDVAKGVLMASTAAQMSRQAIEDLAQRGNTSNAADLIFAKFPQTVTHPDGGGEYSLAAWHGAAEMPGPLKAYTITNIFEPMWQTVWNNTSKLTDMDKISQDVDVPHQPF